MKRSSSGFTLVEVLMAIVVLTIGLLALVSTAGMTTRMIGLGKVDTHAAGAAARRMEILRLSAYGTIPRCTAPEFATGGPVNSEGITESWLVLPAGSLRHLRVTVTYRTSRGSRTASLDTAVEC